MSLQAFTTQPPLGTAKEPSQVRCSRCWWSNDGDGDDDCDDGDDDDDEYDDDDHHPTTSWHCKGAKPGNSCLVDHVDYDDDSSNFCFNIATKIYKIERQQRVIWGKKCFSPHE